MNDYIFHYVERSVAPEATLTEFNDSSSNRFRDIWTGWISVIYPFHPDQQVEMDS